MEPGTRPRWQEIASRGLQRMMATVLLGGCPSPRVMMCDDGLYCPLYTQCSTDGICLADPSQCQRFEDHTPCRSDLFGRGHCFGESCLPGVRALGMIGAAPNAVPLGGARVAVVDHPEVAAVVTDEVGQFDLPGLPRRTSVMLHVQAPGYWDGLSRMFEIGDDELILENDPQRRGLIPLLSPELLEAIGGQAGVTFDPARAIVAAQVWSVEPYEGLSGATGRVTGTSCEGVIYFDAGGVPTTQGATIGESDGVFALYNCEPAAVIEVSVDHPGFTDCAVAFPDEPAVIQASAAASTMTYAGRILCR